MKTALDVLIGFVALYHPVVTAALWIAGGILFRLIDERATRRYGPLAAPA